MTYAIGRLRRCAWLVPAVLSAPAVGQEVYGLLGGQYAPSLREASYAFSMEYLQNLSEHTYATFTWLNEGHVTNHHRDGYSAQLWLRWLSESRRLALSAGVGPWHYYDTTYLTSTGTVTDAHDWGVLGSVAAHYYFRNPWVMELRYNYAHTSTSIKTHTLLFGFGYQFEHGASAGPVHNTRLYGFVPDDQRNELTVMAGKSVVNNFNSPHGVAYGAEYRYRVTPYIDAIGTWLDEGNARVIKRRGPAAQAGIKREFLNHRADVGVAGGFYFARDQDLRGARTEVLGLLTMTATYRVTNGWRVRAYWYRTLTTNGRDTDVAMLGLGYAF
jgi:hypothetical protein